MTCEQTTVVISPWQASVRTAFLEAKHSSDVEKNSKGKQFVGKFGGNC